MNIFEFTTYEEAINAFIEQTGGYVENPEDYIMFDGEVYWYKMNA